MTEASPPAHAGQVGLALLGMPTRRGCPLCGGLSTIVYLGVSQHFLGSLVGVHPCQIFSSAIPPFWCWKENVDSLVVELYLRKGGVQVKCLVQTLFMFKPNRPPKISYFL